MLNNIQTDKAILKSTLYKIPLFLLMIWITACNAKIENSPIADPLLTFTPLVSATSTYTSTAKPTRTPLPPTFTPRPSKTPGPSPTKLPPGIAYLNSNSNNYTLVEPNPEVINKVLQYNQDNKNLNLWSDNNTLFDLINQDNNYINTTMMFSLKRQANKEPLKIDQIHNLFKWFAWLSGEASDIFASVLIDAVKADIYQQAFTFEDQKTIEQPFYNLTSYIVELDYDRNAEWLVRVELSQTGLLAWFLFDQTEESIYRLLDSDLPIYKHNESFERKILLLKDFTGDGITDVLLSEEAYQFGNYFTNFYALYGNRTGFKQIKFYIERTYAYDGPVPYELVEVNGLDGLKMVFYEDLNWGCSWAREVRYWWPNGLEQKTETSIYPPDIPECDLAQAVSLTQPVDDQTMQRYLLSAINRLNIQDEEQREKAAFTHYRLAIIYNRNGNGILARKHLNQLLQLYPEFSDAREYLEENLEPIFSETSINSLRLCQIGYNAPYETFSLWWEYANSMRIYQTYPGGEPVPEAICPLFDMVDSMVEEIQFNGVGTPEEALQIAGLPIHSLNLYPLPGSERPAWFVVLDIRPYSIIANVPREEGFVWRRMDIFDRSNTPPMVLNKDVTGDGINELVIAAKSYTQGGCTNGWTYQLHLTGSPDKRQLTSIGGNECLSAIEEPNLAELMADHDGDGLSDLLVEQVGKIHDDGFITSIVRQGPLMWFTEEERIQNFPSLFSQETDDQTDLDPQQELLSGINLKENREKLQVMQASLSSQEMYYDHIYARLSYLIALSYQLEGQNDKAIELFLELATGSPRTTWSNLAAGHLKEK